MAVVGRPLQENREAPGRHGAVDVSHQPDPIAHLHPHAGLYRHPVLARGHPGRSRGRQSGHHGQEREKNPERKEPASPLAHHPRTSLAERGAAAIEEGDLEEAERGFDVAVREAPDNPLPWIGLCEVEATPFRPRE